MNYVYYKGHAIKLGNGGMIVVNRGTVIDDGGNGGDDIPTTPVDDIPSTGVLWVFDPSSTIVTIDPDYPTWHSYSDGKFTLSEPADTSAPSHYPYARISFGKTIDITNALYSAEVSTAYNNATASVWLEDANGNLSDPFNMGKNAHESDVTTLGVFAASDTASQSTHGSFGDTGKIYPKTLSPVSLSDFYGSSFNPAKAVAMRFCFANWYQSSASWKERNKSVTFSTMKFEVP